MLDTTYEIQVKPFEPEFTGKLNDYVSAVDKLLKAPDNNPTIGLLICSDMDKTDVQWSFRGITTPMGVATITFTASSIICCIFMVHRLSAIGVN